MLTDEIILQNFIKNGKVISVKVSNTWLNIHKDFKEYLDNRYNDSQSYIETLYRMKNKIEIRPVCLECGKPVRFLNYTTGFRTFCGSTCIRSGKIVRERIQQTFIEKYGVDNPAKSKIISQKIKNTNIKKYGVPVPIQNNIIKEKIRKTCIKRYGVDNGAKSEKAIKQMKETNIKKYGSVCPTKNKDVLNKSRQTCLKHYGVISYSQTNDYKEKQSKLMSSNEMQKRRNIIQKERHSFNTSKIEQQFKEYFEQNYPNDFEYQYRSELYPFNCDFYIKSLNLYIEINGSWTHGRHPFDENNQEDIDKLNLWKSKNSGYYQNAIQTWTISDVNKRNIAKENNLNYLEIFSNKLENCIVQLNNYLKGIK